MKKPLIIAFGSQVSGTMTAGSDFDFAVLGDKELSLDERTDICGYLAKHLSINEDKIDLVDLKSDLPILKFEVATKGKLIEGEEFEFTKFKVRAFKEYVDTSKFRRMREKHMLQNHVS